MLKVRIEYDPCILGTNIWIYDEKPDGSIQIVSPLDLSIRTEYKRGVMVVDPTLRLSRTDGEDFLNSLSNALVIAGFKPDELKAHNKETSAIKYHLEDMRKLVFKNKKECA